TAQDAADLLAYLAGLQETTLHASAFKALGPFPNEKTEQRGTDFGPEKDAGAVDLAAKYDGKGGRTIGWFAITAQNGPTGVPVVDLKKIGAESKTASDNVIYYFAVTIESSAEQPAVLAIGSDDGIQAWLNGKRVHDHKVTRVLTPGEDKISVQLKTGRNL